MDWLWPAAERAGLPVALLAANFLPLVGKELIMGRALCQWIGWQLPG